MSATPGQARDHVAEERTREFRGWMEAQGLDADDEHNANSFITDEMAEAFTAGFQAAEDLRAAQQPHAATFGQADPYARAVEQLAKVRAIVFRSDTQQSRIRDLVELLDPAIAAQEPHAADGDAPAIVDRAVKEWLDRRTATALATAPGIDDRERGKRQGIDDLRQRLDDYWYTLTPSILAALGTPEPRPAPELAAAMRESRLRAEVITEILAAFGPSGSGHTARVGQVQIAKWRTRAGLTT